MTIGAFVDCSSLNRSCQLLFDQRLDFEKVAKRIEEEGEIAKMVAFVKHIEAGNIEIQNKFDVVLTKVGYEVRTKTVNKNNTDDRSTSWNVGLTLAAVDSMTLWDTAVLGAQDGGLVDLVRYLNKKDKKVIIVGFRQATSYKLVKNSSKFIDLDRSFIFEGKHGQSAKSLKS